MPDAEKEEAPPQKAPKGPMVWHPSQEETLKSWGESSSCYRYMHHKAHEKYKTLTFRFMLPIIIISTVTGTANFAQGTFPSGWVAYVPSVIGAFNLFAAIMTTILQHQKYNELMESHRVASIQYGKLARNIRLELAMPIRHRSSDGENMVGVCRAEYDRLIEQSPAVPKKIIIKFKRDFALQKRPRSRPPPWYIRVLMYCRGNPYVYEDEDAPDQGEDDNEFTRPEIMGIKPIKTFDNETEERKLLELRKRRREEYIERVEKQLRMKKDAAELQKLSIEMAKNAAKMKLMRPVPVDPPPTPAPTIEEITPIIVNGGEEDFFESFDDFRIDVEEPEHWPTVQDMARQMEERIRMGNPRNTGS